MRSSRPGSRKGRARITRRAFLGAVLASTACRGANAGDDQATRSNPATPAPQPQSGSTPATAPGNTSAPGRTLATLRLLTGGAGRYPWCAGHAFRVADVPAGATLAGLQMTVKSTWPDGSAKMAILAGTVAAAGTSTQVALRVGTPAGGRTLTLADLKATGVKASIGASPYGTATWADADWDTPFLVWVQGPMMSSWIYRRPVGNDAHLTAWLEVRLFPGGEEIGRAHV